MYAILGEDKSDVATLKVILKRLIGDDSIKIKTKGYNGCAELLRKGAKQITAFSKLGLAIFVVCYDSDGKDPAKRYSDVVSKIIKPTGLKNTICVVIPVQELEAWILADIQSVTNVFSSWKPKEINNPESIDNPKEYLEKLSRDCNRRPRYNHATHNEKIAPYLDLDKLKCKCPSFLPLVTLAENHDAHVAK